jgi:hypothetical protein
MGYRFNPPPNWPAPPPGWSPPPGWRPDPSWPAPPSGWSFWVNDGDGDAAPAGIPKPERTVAEPVTRRFWAWFRRLPGWAKALVVVLAIGLSPWLLIALGVTVVVLAIVVLLAGPMPRFRLDSRAAAIGALVLGLTCLGAGGALASATLPDQTTSTSQPSVAGLPSTTSASPALVATTTEPVTTLQPTTTAQATTTSPPTTRPPTTTQGPRPATTRPAPPKTTRPVSLCGAPPNPYGLNLCGRGSHVFHPPADVCDYFNCIANFSNGVGYMEQCQDGMYSMSGGRQGACSHHGGERQAVFRP